MRIATNRDHPEDPTRRRLLPEERVSKEYRCKRGHTIHLKPQRTCAGFQHHAAPECFECGDGTTMKRTD